ncbi:hypothetical protein [Candidatus Methanoperedens nitratireducens]|uniref:hypothetical protein n=1 Tax=Candidatus Methanoperedens nitratireducens TaxID=1392998 RepID=UPI000BB8FF59|nr:hypothetical protein [Candidatus Methanoperedens nitroreducens]
MKPNLDIPPFTKYEPCPTCGGRGWKRERGGYSLIPCPTCFTARKLPILEPDGRFLKRGQEIEITEA